MLKISKKFYIDNSGRNMQKKNQTKKNVQSYVGKKIILKEITMLKKKSD